MTTHTPILHDMVAHMKTTVDIADELFRAAKELARAEGSTLRSLIEEGLRSVLERRRASGAFTLRDASFEGRGVRPGLDEGSWDSLAALIYEERGS